MFIPLHDVNRLKYIRTPYVNYGLIALNVGIWLLSSAVSTEESAALAALGLGYIPAVQYDLASLSPELELVPSAFTYVTYAFLHLDFWHLTSNMIFLWVFGDNVEDALGHMRYLVFYLLCAVAGALMHGIAMPNSDGPLIGASGAISGVVAAYFLLHPRVRVWVLVFMRIPLPLPAYIPLLLWIAQQFVLMFISEFDDVSWAAHVGGILAGVLLIIIMRRNGVPLFDKNLRVLEAPDNQANEH